MPFQYRIKRKAVGAAPYTTRPDLAPSATQEEIIEQMSKESGVSPGEIQNVMTTLRSVLIGLARDTRPTEVLFDLFRVGLSSGGAVADPEQTLTFADIQPSLNLYLSTGAQHEFATDLTLERTGVDAARAAILDLVRNDRTDTLDAYTPGDVLRITGDNLKVLETDATQGVFLRPDAGGAEVRVVRYVENTSGTLAVLIPAGTAGAQRLIVRVKCGNALRETVYGPALVQE
jgi:hypothetical protein